MKKKKDFSRPSVRALRHSPVSGEESAVALVLTLLVVAMLTVVVVGFTTVSRLEQSAARNMTYQASAEQLAQLATGRAMQRLSEAMEAAAAAPMFSTQPGQINLFGAPPERLYSSGGATTNVNRFTTNGLITGNPSDNITVGVETVDDSAGNPLGRIAFYIDDESTKIAVNQATGASNNRTLNPQWPRPFAIQGANGVNAVRAGNFNGILTSAANNASNSSNWTYFFTPEQLRVPLTAEPLAQLTVALETNPAAMNTTPWGAQKIRINQIAVTDQGVQELAQALSDPNLAQVFGQTFADKYTPTGLQQLAANMLQLRTDHWRGAPIFGGVDAVLGTSQLGGNVTATPDSGTFKRTNGIPSTHFGYVPFPMLSEVGVSFVYGWESTDRLTVRIFLECELFNPFPIDYPGGGQIYAQIDKALFNTVYLNPPGQAMRGPEGTAVRNPWGGAQGPPAWGPPGANTVLNPPQGYHPATLPIPAVPAGTYVAVPPIQFDVEFTDTNSAVQVQDLLVVIDQIKLLAEANTANSIRDWCSGYDFDNALTVSAGEFNPAVGPASGPYGGPQNPVPLPLTPPGQVVAISKMDPRMRPPLQAATQSQQNPPGKGWEESAPTIGLANSIGPANFIASTIPSDAAYANDLSLAVYNTNLPPILSTSDGAYAMAADFGKVFTGFPWRTLRMQPQPSVESSAGLIPDWVLLDAVSFGDGTRALNSANPNSQIISQAAPVTRRTAALRSQLDVLTNQTLNVIAHPITAGGTNTALFSATASRAFSTNATGLGQIASNAQRPELPASWSASSTWPTRRAALGFPPNALLLPSEMTEIRGVADFLPAAGATVNSNKFNEYRLSTLFPGAGSRSRFFRVYALGEALEGRTANAPVAAKAFLQTLVAVDTNTTPPAIRILNQYPPAE